MTPPSDPTSQAIIYGQALAATLRAFPILESRAGWFERQLIRLLRATYRQRLRHLVTVLPPEIADQILTLSNLTERRRSTHTET